MKNELIKNDWRWVEIQETESYYIAGVDPYSTDSKIESTNIKKPAIMEYEMRSPDIARMKTIFIGSYNSLERLN